LGEWRLWRFEGPGTEETEDSSTPLSDALLIRIAHISDLHVVVGFPATLV